MKGPKLHTAKCLNMAISWKVASRSNLSASISTTIFFAAFRFGFSASVRLFIGAVYQQKREYPSACIQRPLQKQRESGQKRKADDEQEKGEEFLHKSLFVKEAVAGEKRKENGGGAFNACRDGGRDKQIPETY